MGLWQVDADDIRKAAETLDREQNGLQLRRELAANLRDAVRPAVDAARGAILSMSDHGLAAEGEPLRAAIASKIRAKARLTGRGAGVRVSVPKKGMPRGFANAPKRTNSAKGWRHPVPPPRLPDGVQGPLRPPVWVHQIGKPGWFDDTLRRHRKEYRQAVKRAVDSAAQRISRGAR